MKIQGLKAEDFDRIEHQKFVLQLNFISKLARQLNRGECVGSNIN